MLTDRRRFLTVLATLPAAGVARANGTPPTLSNLLDQAAALKTPERMFRFLGDADQSGLDDESRRILAMVRQGIGFELDLKKAFPFGKSDGSSPYVVSPRHGAYLRLGELAPDRAAASLREETERLRADAALGIILPRVLLHQTIAAQRSASAAVPDGKLRAGLDEQTAVLEGQLAQAPDEPGVWRLPRGLDYYERRLRGATGAAITPAELERRVQGQAGKLLARADHLLRGQGLSRGSIGARLRALKTQPGLSYPATEAGRKQAVADMNDALDRVRPLLPRWFAPPVDTRAEIRLMTPEELSTGKRGYRDAQARIYYPDLGAVADRPGWTLVTVAYHETLPGHLLQIDQAGPIHPLQARYAAGYFEGWAVYAESLVANSGLLTPRDELGAIQSQLFRLARVSTDIGIHVHRWTRARAIQWMRDMVGFDLFFSLEAEVDRYCIEPGSFAGDALVYLTLESRKGDLRSIHSEALNHGPLTAPFLVG